MRTPPTAADPSPVPSPLPAPGARPEAAPGMAAEGDGEAPLRALRRAAALALPDDRRPVLLAVSGGSDSTALLGAAALVLPRAQVVHVHHGLRPEADADADFVDDLARQFGLDATRESAPPGARDPARTETAARRRRYRALVEVARRLGASRVLTAHHLDDDLETLLLHARRGHRGPRAACGVPAVRPLAPDGSVLVVRPFVMGPAPLGRDDLARWRRSRGWACVEDATNADRSVPRNAVRAWLSGVDDAEELRARLVALRRSARARLQHTVGRAADLLARHLHRAGLGARLDRAALEAVDAADEPQVLITELLRLLGPCLAAPRRLDPRGPLVRDLWAAGRRGSGELRLPADPDPLVFRAGRAGLHLPHAAPAPGSPSGRVLTALGRTSLYC